MKNEDLNYIKNTMKWMIENMELKDPKASNFDILYNNYNNCVSALAKEIFLNDHECEPVSLKGKYSHCKHCGMNMQLKK
jgi:hypothetical protein